MGKKGKKTRWRELPITLADKPYEHQQSSRHATDSKPANFAAAAGRRGNHTQHQVHYQHQSPSRGNHAASNGQQHHNNRVESSTVTFNEDEYTKITTPRQDVLFKKGYLGRRKHTSLVPVINEALNENEDDISTDAIINPLDEMCAHGEYVDPSAIYILSGGGYDIYDPYTGNMTPMMGPGNYPPGGHPMLTAMFYQTMPLPAVDWYGPPNPPANEPWMTTYHAKKHYKRMTAEAKQNSSVQTSEAGNGVQEPCLDDQQSLYHTQQPYVYPGYVYGAPLYDYNGIQVPQPQSPPSPTNSCDYTNGKRRKKKKRRKRGGVTDEYSDSSSEEQKSQSGASSDLHVLDSEKTSDSGVMTNNSGGSTPVNVLPVQLSHSAPPFHMECPPPPQPPPPFEIYNGAPILVHHHHLHHPDQLTAYYHQPIPQYAEQLVAPIGYQVIPEEQPADELTADDLQPDGGQATSAAAAAAANYSAENSDSGISSPNSEVMVKQSAVTDGKRHEKPSQAVVDDGGQTTVTTASAATATSTTTTTTTTATTTKKSRNKKSKRTGGAAAAAAASATAVTATVATDKTAAESACAKTKGCKETLPKNNHHDGCGKKSSKIAKEPAIIKKLNARKAGKGKTETGKSGVVKDEDRCDKEDKVSGDVVMQLSICNNGPEAEWIQDEVFCSLECTPRSTATDNVQFQFTKTQSLDSCESAEEETFASAVMNTGNSDTETEIVIRQDRDGDADKLDDSVSTPPSSPSSPSPHSLSPINVAAAPGPITEAVTKWLNDQGGLMLARPCLQDDDAFSTDCTDEGDSEYDDFEENPSTTAAPAPAPNTTSSKNAQGNPYPALSRNDNTAGSRVAGASSSHDQRQGGLISSGICCLTQ